MINCLLSSTLLALLLVSCATNKVLEQHGDKALKNITVHRTGYYMGIAESRVSYDEALRRAMATIQTQIVNELGVSVRVVRTDIDRQMDTHSSRNRTGEYWGQYWSQQVFQLESEHNISTKINRLYYEKTADNIFKVWVEVRFDRDTYYENYRSFWRDTLRNMRGRDIVSSVQHYEHLLTLKDRFENEKPHLTSDIIRDYDTTFQSLRSTFNNILQNISVQNIATGNKFSNNFRFRFTNRSTNEPLNGLPVLINGKQFTTDTQGTVNYTADYQHPVVIYIGHRLNEFVASQIYQNDTFSPYIPKNITLGFQCNDTNLRGVFSALFANKGYRVSGTPDIVLEIIPTQNTRLISANQYLTELRLRINLKTNNRTVRTINMPPNSNETINGHGTSQNEAISNAFSLNWYGYKDRDIAQIEQSIREILTGNK